MDEPKLDPKEVLCDSTKFLDFTIRGTRWVFDRDPEKEYAPMLVAYLIGADGVAPALGTLEGQSADERAADAFKMGIKVGRKAGGMQLEAISFISEAWMSQSETKDIKVMPRDDPNRKEVIAILTKVRGQKIKSANIEIKRGINSSGNVVRMLDEHVQIMDGIIEALIIKAFEYGMESVKP